VAAVEADILTRRISMSHPYFDLDGKVAVVIGGTSGIGLSIALGLAEAGADVIPTSRRGDKVKDAVKAVESKGRRSLAMAIDATRRKEVEKLASAVMKEFGRIDILVNSAGTLWVGPFAEMPENEYERVMDVNLRATVLTCQIIGKVMIEQKGGKIVNISSMAALWGQPDILPYCMSKGGIAQLTKGLAVEWARYNIQVNDIAPGLFITPLSEEVFTDPVVNKRLKEKTPMGRLGELDELQGAAVFLASRASDFITGESIRVDGGLFINGTL
jgi:NAD(P)-dependent dehydrogenase (short-subunit alcohol dehydrogenase family)